MYQYQEYITPGLCTLASTCMYCECDTVMCNLQSRNNTTCLLTCSDCVAMTSRLRSSRATACQHGISGLQNRFGVTGPAYFSKFPSKWAELEYVQTRESYFTTPWFKPVGIRLQHGDYVKLGRASTNGVRVRAGIAQRAMTKMTIAISISMDLDFE